MAEEEKQKMNEATKIIFAFVGVMLIGFFIVGTSGQTEKQQQDSANMMHYSNLSRMSTVRCPQAIKKMTGANVYQIIKTDTDRQTYFTVEYEKTEAFEHAKCTVNQLGVLTKLIVDGKALISK